MEEVSQLSFLTSGIYYGSRGFRGMYFDWTYLLAIAGLILTLLAFFPAPADRCAGKTGYFPLYC